MKQRITVEQIKELSDEQRKKLRDWWLMEEHYDIREKGIHDVFIDLKRYPLLSIGQMIELLHDSDVSYRQTIENNNYTDGLCDALWEAVKTVL